MKKSLFAVLSVLCGVITLGGADGVLLKDVSWNRPDAVEKTPSGTFLMKKNALIQSREKFKVDPKASYKITLTLRKSKAEMKDSFAYVGFASFQANGTVIASPEVEVFEGTETVITSDAPRRSKTFFVKDVSKWPRRNQAHVVAFNVKKDLADLPNNKFSGNVDKIEKKGDVYEITVRYPLAYALKKGTPVRLHRHAAGRNFCAPTRRLRDDKWITVSGVIKGVAPKGAALRQWWKGTAQGGVALSLASGVEFKDLIVEKLSDVPRK